MKQWIQIWYSWGDQESPVEVPEGRDAWEYMAHLAVKEARIELVEHEPDIDVMVQFSKDMGKVTLHYTDGQRCYYQITDTEDVDMVGEDKDEEESDNEV